MLTRLFPTKIAPIRRSFFSRRLLTVAARAWPSCSSWCMRARLAAVIAVSASTDETTTLDQSLDDAKIIGVCDLSRQEFDLPNHSLAPDFGLYLTALAVHPAYRRRGIASRLLDYADAIARDGDLGQLVLHVETDNDAAVGFYEASEFRKERNDAEYKQFATALNLNPELHALYSRPTEH